MLPRKNFWQKGSKWPKTAKNGQFLVFHILGHFMLHFDQSALKNIFLVVFGYFNPILGQTAPFSDFSYLLTPQTFLVHFRCKLTCTIIFWQKSYYFSSFSPFGQLEPYGAGLINSSQVRRRFNLL